MMHAASNFYSIEFFSKQTAEIIANGLISNLLIKPRHPAHPPTWN